MSSSKKVLTLCTLAILLVLSGLLAACAGNTDLLPHSVYYLDCSQGDCQVWKMEADGTTVRQLTYEPTGVDDFSVSRTDGSLVFVTANQLFLVDPAGENRRLVAESPEGEQGDYPALVGSPVLSPDGRTLAYALDGLHLYDVASGEDERVLADGGNLLGEPFVFEKEYYAPGPWSPDGNKLLVVMGYFEGSTLAVMEPGIDEPFRRLWSSGPVCCTYSWSPDSSSVFVANPSFTTIWPGLWRYDVETGEEFPLVVTLPQQSRFVGWPVQLSSGELRYFYGEKFTFEGGIPLVLVRSGADGGDRTLIRPEEFHVANALWAEDGSLVLILSFSGDRNTESRTANIILARPDTSPLQVLLEVRDIRQMEWGP